MKRSSKRGSKVRWPFALLSLAIVLIAGVGFAGILGGYDLSIGPALRAQEADPQQESNGDTPLTFSDLEGDQTQLTDEEWLAIEGTSSDESLRFDEGEDMDWDEDDGFDDGAETDRVPDKVVGANPSLQSKAAKQLPQDGPSAPGTDEPTLEPTVEPTLEPTVEPTLEPTPEPTPAGPLTGLKIGIDPGHQLHANNGTEPVSPGGKEKKAKVASGTRGVSSKVDEHVVNLQMSLILKELLEGYGAEVLMTRESADVDISNVERAKMMNEWGADLVLRIHCNGVSSRKNNGIGLYVAKSADNAQASYAAAKPILSAMLEATGARKDGIFKRDIYSGLNWSTVPSILVECGYMSNPDEDKKLNDPDYQTQLMQGITSGVAQYFERELPQDAAPSDAEGEQDQPAEED